MAMADVSCAQSTPIQISLSDSKAIDAFYTLREGKPYWLENGELSDNAIALMSIIQQAWLNGLNPNVYNYQEIFNLQNVHDLDGTAQLNFELALTDAFLKYVRDLSGMRVKAEKIGLEPSQWRQRVPAVQALALLNDDINDMGEFLLSLEPQSKAYQLLKDEMRQLAAANESDAPEDIIKFGGLIKPGQGAKDIPKLRARFGLDQPSDEKKYMYDAELVAAVKVFQSEKGLKADGIIGQRTVNMFNLSRAEKIKRLVVNMERLRWIKNDNPSRFIVVNIPASRLIAVKDGQVKVDMPVVVGRKKRETLSFVALVDGIRFNPTWTVPPTIRNEDIVPKLQEDPKYLLDKGMEIYKKVGEEMATVDPATVDWRNITKAELATYKMIQSAGDHNPLGRIRVLMPNSHNIYLHDTNHPELFDRSNLAQSSGCVRMKYPEKIANFVLEDLKGWSDAKMIEILKSGKTKDYYIDGKIPVYLVYNTVWIGEKDQVIYGNDIYDLDNKLLQLIEKSDGFKIADQGKNRVAKSVN